MIDATRVKEILFDCFYKEDEIPSDGSIPTDAIKVEGIVRNFGFNPKKIEIHREEINSLIDELDPTIKEGMSFIMFPMDKNGNQWGEQYNAEQLIALGIAIGRLQYCLPRMLWQVCPGGVPYIQDTKEVNNNE